MAELGSWTRAARAGLDTDTGRGAVVPPIYLSTNYTFHAPGEPRAHDYSRSANPTREVLTEALAALEGGCGAVALGTGMATATLLINALVPVGARVIVPHDAYGGTWRLFTMLHEQGRLVVDFCNFQRPEDVARAFAEPANLVWVETPSNPLLRLTDIADVAKQTEAIGAKLAVDNTFCTPLLQHPLQLGADFVVHSTTKFISGHSDVVGGAVVAKDPELLDQLKLWSNALGLTAGAFDSYLVMRGLRSLEARLRVHAENAEACVDVLDGHPAISTLHYPGLPDHPDYELGQRQMSGSGSIISFNLAGGQAAVARFLDGLEIFHLAESLGGIESLVCHPGTMTHAAMSPTAQTVAGISEGLIRLSVGLEGRDDLVAVLAEALERAS